MYLSNQSKSVRIHSTTNNPIKKPDDKPAHPLDHYHSLLQPKSMFEVRNTLFDDLSKSIIRPSFVNPRYIGPKFPLEKEGDRWQANFWFKDLTHSKEEKINDSLWIIAPETESILEIIYNIHADNMTNNTTGVLRVKIEPIIKNEKES